MMHLQLPSNPACGWCHIYLYSVQYGKWQDYLPNFSATYTDFYKKCAAGCHPLWNKPQSNIVAQPNTQKSPSGANCERFNYYRFCDVQEQQPGDNQSHLIWFPLETESSKFKQIKQIQLKWVEEQNQRKETCCSGHAVLHRPAVENSWGWAVITQWIQIHTERPQMDPVSFASKYFMSNAARKP